MRSNAASCALGLCRVLAGEELLHFVGLDGGPRVVAAVALELVTEDVLVGGREGVVELVGVLQTEVRDEDDRGQSVVAVDGAGAPVVGARDVVVVLVAELLLEDHPDVAVLGADRGELVAGLDHGGAVALEAVDRVAGAGAVVQLDAVAVGGDRDGRLVVVGAQVDDGFLADGGAGGTDLVGVVDDDVVAVAARSGARTARQEERHCSSGSRQADVSCEGSHEKSRFFLNVAHVCAVDLPFITR